MLTTRLLFAMSYSRPNQDLLNAARDKTDDSTTKLEIALEQGADLNITDIRIKNEVNTIGYKYTPLMWAAYNGQLNKVKYLISRGADIYATTGHHNTALHIAAREGKVEVADYLANLYPQLLTKEGEANKIPSEIAQTYGKYRKINELFAQSYYNPYFGPIKNQLAAEIALLIALNINDPITLKNLSLVNKAWNALAKQDIYQFQYEQSLRQYLPQHLQQLTWSQIYQHYFPGETAPKNTFVGFIKRLHTVYMQGDKIQMLVDKSKTEELKHDLIALPFILAHWDNKFPSNKKYREIKATEVEDNINHVIDIAKTGNIKLKVFRQLQDAANAELTEAKRSVNLYHNQCQERQPIFTVQVDNQATLSLCQTDQKSTLLASNGMFRVKDWRLAKDPYTSVINVERQMMSRK